MYYCDKRSVWISDLGIHIDVIDAIVEMLPDGKVTWQKIEIPPYVFIITDNDEGQWTLVSKYVTLNKKPWDKQNAMAWKRENILKISAAMNLPWNDRKTVLEKLRLYLLFS